MKKQDLFVVAVALSCAGVFLTACDKKEVPQNANPTGVTATATVSATTPAAPTKADAKASTDSQKTSDAKAATPAKTDAKAADTKSTATPQK